MTEDNLPVKDSENFCGEFETMKLDELYDKMFLVAASTGDRNKCKFLSSTVHGPYTFYEMCEEVGQMYCVHNHHAKITILGKDSTKAPIFLDETATDYIEAHYVDLVTDGLLQGEFEKKEYTCRPGLIEATPDEEFTKVPDAT